jgi:hypothetical protein
MSYGGDAAGAPHPVVLKFDNNIPEGTPGRLVLTITPVCQAPPYSRASCFYKGDVQAKAAWSSYQEQMARWTSKEENRLVLSFGTTDRALSIPGPTAPRIMLRLLKDDCDRLPSTLTFESVGTSGPLVFMPQALLRDTIAVAYVQDLRHPKHVLSVSGAECVIVANLVPED